MNQFILLLTITRNTHLTLKRPWILQNHASFCFRLSAVSIMEVKFIYFRVPILNIFFLFNPAYRCHLVKNVISVPIVTSSITFLKFPGLSFPGLCESFRSDSLLLQRFRVSFNDRTGKGPLHPPVWIHLLVSSMSKYFTVSGHITKSDTGIQTGIHL